MNAVVSWEQMAGDREDSPRKRGRFLSKEDWVGISKPEIAERPLRSYAVRSAYISKLRSLASMSNGWGEHNSLAPTWESIHAAIDLINRLPAEKLATRVGVSTDGEISLFWEKDDFFADIGLCDGELSYYIRDAQGGELLGDHPLANLESLAGQLIESLPSDR